MEMEDPVNSLDRSAEEKERLQALGDGESDEGGEPGADLECASLTQRKTKEWGRPLPSVSDGSMYLFWIGSELRVHFLKSFDSRTKAVLSIVHLWHAQTLVLKSVVVVVVAAAAATVAVVAAAAATAVLHDVRDIKFKIYQKYNPII